MARITRNFSDRGAEEQNWLVSNTWCDYCAKADVGLTQPIEYEENGQVFVEGKCARCGQRVVSFVNEQNT